MVPTEGNHDLLGEDVDLFKVFVDSVHGECDGSDMVGTSSV
jgi:hypothetical protein